MTAFADQLARLRVAIVTGTLPADLGTWALAELAARADGAERRALRDRLLGEAARALLPTASTWARATALRDELVAIERRGPGMTDARRLIAAALELDANTPRSARQLFAILKSEAFRFQTEPDDGR